MDTRRNIYPIKHINFFICFEIECRNIMEYLSIIFIQVKSWEMTILKLSLGSLQLKAVQCSLHSHDWQIMTRNFKRRWDVLQSHYITTPSRPPWMNSEIYESFCESRSGHKSARFLSEHVASSAMITFQPPLLLSQKWCGLRTRER